MKRATRSAPETPAVDIDVRLAALDEAVSAGAAVLDPVELSRLNVVRERAAERLASGGHSVVAALGGGTGSGKSSLFNALAERELSEVGARRPVTAEVVGLVVGDVAAATPVLDWLGVPHRHHAAPGDAGPDGLVLLDLPDHDSVDVRHRLIVDRYVERVDVLVWVVDPLKYAQRALHAEYFRRLAEHASVLLVVLNRVDELAPGDRNACITDLHALLEDEGLGEVEVLVTSALTGEGVEDLRAALATHVRARRAAADRIAADIRTVARDLLVSVGTGEGHVPEPSHELVAALAGSADAEKRVVEATETFTTEAVQQTRPLVTSLVMVVVGMLRRLVRGWRPRPSRPRVGVTPSGSVVAVRAALLDLADHAAEGIPPRFAARYRGALGDVEGIITAVQRQIADVDLLPPPRRWWLPLAIGWSAIELVALAGLAWLLAAIVTAWLGLPDLPMATVGDVGLPWLLLVGGAVAWLVIRWLRMLAIARGERNLRKQATKLLGIAVVRALRSRVLQVIADEVANRKRLITALETASR